MHHLVSIISVQLTSTISVTASFLWALDFQHCFIFKDKRTTVI